MKSITTTRVRLLIPSISQWRNTLARTLQRSSLLWLCNNNRQTWNWQVLVGKQRWLPRWLTEYTSCGSDAWGAPTSRRRCTHKEAAAILAPLLGENTPPTACHVISPVSVQLGTLQATFKAQFQISDHPYHVLYFLPVYPVVANVSTGSCELSGVTALQAESRIKWNPRSILVVSYHQLESHLKTRQRETRVW